MTTNPNRRRGPVRRALAYFRHPALTFWVAAIVALAVVAVVIARDGAAPPEAAPVPTAADAAEWRQAAISLASPTDAAAKDPVAVRAAATELATTASRYSLVSPKWRHAANTAQALADNPTDVRAHRDLVDAANALVATAVLPPGAPQRDVPANDPVVAVLGESEQAAAASLEGAGWSVRVVSRDGESFMATQDYRDDRVNLSVVDGTVVSVFIG